MDALTIRPSKKGRSEIVEVRCRVASASAVASVVERLRQLPEVRAVRADIQGVSVATGA